jgi:hypothetical protein
MINKSALDALLIKKDKEKNMKKLVIIVRFFFMRNKMMTL